MPGRLKVKNKNTIEYQRPNVVIKIKNIQAKNT